MSPEYISKTAVATPFCLFEFVRKTFGLKGASFTFQKFMDKIFAILANVDPYIDDLIVAIDTEE